MLSEIYSEAFKEKGETRDKVEFHAGLNLVVGGNRATNSIGKTTFLLAIDFALGGSTYINAAGDMIKNVGHHTVCFAHSFGNVAHHFSRSTDTPNIVSKCDSKYRETSSISLEEYTAWLTSYYGLSGLGGTFRSLQSPFFRVYGMNHDNVDRPLISHNSDKVSKDLQRLLKLFGRYEGIASLDGQVDEIEDKRKAYREDAAYKIITPTGNAHDYRRNVEKLKMLHSQMEDILSSSDNGTTDFDTAKEERAAQLRNALKNLRRQRMRIDSAIREIGEDLEFIDFKATNDFENLKSFFPSVDLARFEEIEAFHRGITRILEKNHSDELKNLRAEREELEGQIAQVENSLSDLGATTNLSATVIERYADLKTVYDELSAANSLYDKNRESSKQLKARKVEREEAWRAELDIIQPLLNDEMDDLNEKATDPYKTAPRIDLASSKEYRFSVPNDGGTGSRYRGLFIFDIAMLRLSSLQFAIHDSLGLKQIEDDHVLGILQLYGSLNKQVFAAIDKVDSLTAESSIPEIVQKNMVLELSEGQELFGWSWNRKTELDESEE